MKELPLNRGYVALVDDEDYDYVSQWKWSVAIRGTRYYAQRADKNRKFHLLHTDIMEPPKGMVVDHINHNGLDCRRSNMRICTTRDNVRNGRPRGAVSGFKGVYPSGTRTKRFQARIRVNYRLINIGLYGTAEEAARAYDAAARKYFGEFACLNFPEGANG